ncbi:Phosphatase OS=Streptomyces fumanus OX=67302 GN=GCM10018772_54530 PE=4 SV=1 [Streptomyces fumanus]
MNIGGDWYDAFHRPDGSLITVIGDVTGHGLHAAVMMSQLRTALRAYAVDDGSPGLLLTRLHKFLHRLQPNLYATAVIARFHPDESTLTWAAAGHPPPVLRLPDGRVRTLDAKPGAMLGIPLRAGDRRPHRAGGARLDADALHGRAGRAPCRGHRSGHRAALGLRSAPFGPAELDTDLEGAADRILKPLLSDSERDDDVCLLLCHLQG